MTRKNTLTKSYKINNQINVPQLRVIGDEGKQIGILSKDEAVDYALGQGMDLVLIGETAEPPVAKITDYKKFLYQEEKKAKEAKKGQRASGVKEVRVGSPFAAAGDIETRARQTITFLEAGYLVKVVVKFVGRSITHPEFGHRILNQIAEKVAGKGKIDKAAHFEGKFLSMTLSPVK
ncbi:translation initiation factor IF-3 [Candidatus Gottesmanbacteria bacterium RIFCSPHIGHO2_01_FULL_42_12]|uniref:Translation initiation factor IF-3 n=1 Tax=Candidatus Gottesmanbacteria bacterium RIFCSPHIGHO2_01_FULL_42_12 TaxID=1798377 RepID=A0A1F5Z1U7_9BACT|nr:MAG: translation initiation factor IF-3 [Candidatus Gottesmanbacteria bacterium RIFCSPHIGHO2_01_FULL_42_12]